MTKTKMAAEVKKELEKRAELEKNAEELKRTFKSSPADEYILQRFDLEPRAQWTMSRAKKVYIVIFDRLTRTYVKENKDSKAYLKVNTAQEALDWLRSRFIKKPEDTSRRQMLRERYKEQEKEMREYLTKKLPGAGSEQLMQYYDSIMDKIYNDAELFTEDQKDLTKWCLIESLRRVIKW